LIEKSLPKAERVRRARALAYEEALERYNHELLDVEERCELLSRIKRLGRAIALEDVETVDAIHSGLERL
jgi:hypothetical protein